MASNDTVIIDRSYVDNFSMKKYTEEQLVDKYFEDIDPSLRTVGMIGFTTEQVTNIAEDAFNTGTVLFRETFPNRAQVPESIYSHAAIFQLSDIFSSAASCNFLLVMEESAIVKNMQDSYDKDTGIYYFYIDKDTVLYVEDIPFTLDYDIEMRIVKKSNDLSDDYLFSASYIINDYKNSISPITDPYIKIRRSNDGYIALEIKCHQCLRTIDYETIISNNTINYPTLDIEFEGKLAGFDILYKTQKETNYSTQLTPLVVYSQPINEPFCYFTMADEQTLRITFNSKDDYFSPEYGSDLKIILYITNGSEGNFDVYTGNNISLVPTDEKYPYANSYLTAAKPMTSSSGGKDQMPLKALQSLSVMGYRTANALTTEADLNEYFSNYPYLYGGDSNIKFIKRRDDIFERIHMGYLIMKNQDYIYKTNTLNLSLNLSDMNNPEENIYMLEPGLLFTANDLSGFASFLKNEEEDEKLYQDYLVAKENGTIPYIPDNVDKTNIPAYLDRPASFAEYKKRLGIDTKYSVFDFVDDYSLLESMDNPKLDKFLYINPFLIRFKKEPNLVSLYMTYINQKSLVDFTSQNVDSYVQFIIYQLQIEREFSKEKKYKFTINLIPSISIDDEYPIIDCEPVEEDSKEKIYKLGDKFNVVNNDLRVFLVIKDNVKNICYTEFYPTAYNTETEVFTFSAELFTDDHITSDGKLRILDGIIYRNPDNGDYYKVNPNDGTLYNHYNKDGNILESDIAVDDITAMIEEGIIKKWTQTVNMTKSDDIVIPMSDVNCMIYTTYRRVYSETTGKLELVTPDMTNNMIVTYDEGLTNYIWTNEYNTASDPITFLKPLNNVRVNLDFKDYTMVHTVTDDEGNEKQEFVYDIMDVNMYSLPFLRWSMIKDIENLKYFMSSFLAQYNTLVDIINTKLREETSIDVKFYNTYGKSRNFIVGEKDERLNTVNLFMSFDMWFVPGTDLLAAIPEVKEYIKKEVETINTASLNNLYISNLMRKIELNFAYVDHIIFNSINAYDSTYQAVKNSITDLKELTVEERRTYVPELLVIDVDDIEINDYTVE